MPAPAAVRHHALPRFLAWGAGAAVMAVFFGWWFSFEGTKVIGLGSAVPGALALVHLLELVTGVPFAEWSGRWDALPGWKRGVYGGLIALAALLLLALAIPLVIVGLGIR
jgi:hypothetical protein